MSNFDDDEQQETEDQFKHKIEAVSEKSKINIRSYRTASKAEGDNFWSGLVVNNTSMSYDLWPATQVSSGQYDYLRTLRINGNQINASNEEDIED